MLIGYLDKVSRSRLIGWVRDQGHPSSPVPLTISGDGRVLERTVANRHRPDVAAAGHGDGRYGFDIVFDPPLSPVRSWTIHVTSDADGAHVPGSPFRLDPATDFDVDARSAFTAAIADAADPAEIDDRLGYLDGLRARLLAARADHVAGHIGASLARRRGTPPPPISRRALFIDDRPPDPTRDGGSTAALSHMRSLERLGYEVSFASPDFSPGGPSPHLEAAGITHILRPRANSIEDLLRSDAGLYDLVYMYRVTVAACYAGLVRRHQPRARVIYSVADLHHLRLARQALVEERPELLIEARRLIIQEFSLARMADVVVTHSAIETALLRRRMPDAAILTIPWSADTRPSRVPFAERRNIVFIGNYAHAPNLDAARRIREQIMPAVRALDPSITCTLVGDGLPPFLAEPTPGTRYAGHVHDLAALLDRTRLTIAPLAFGAGLKAKVVESLAVGVPCLCSPTAAEGMGFDGALASLVTDGADMVRMIVLVHNDVATQRVLAEAGLQHVCRQHSEERVDHLMRQAAGAPVTVLHGGGSRKCAGAIYPTQSII